MTSKFVGYCSFELKKDQGASSSIARVSSDIDTVRRMIKEDQNPSHQSPVPQEVPGPDLTTDLGKSVWDFYNNLKSLYEIAHMSDFIPNLFVNSFFKNKILKHAEKNFALVETFEGAPVFGLDYHGAEYVSKNIKRWNEVEEGFSKLPQAVLLSIVASFDTAFSEYCKILLKSRPERLASGDKKYALADIVKMGSLDKILEAVADEEIDQIMRKSHSDQIDFFEKMFNVSIKKHYKRWGDFVEIFERRNLCAHGNLVVNEIYIQNCKVHNYDVKVKVGECLDVDSNYLEDALDILIEFGILLAFASWQKQVPSSISESFGAIVEVSFNLLTDDHPKVAANILEYALSVKSKGADEGAVKMMIVNLAIAHKSWRPAKTG